MAKKTATFKTKGVKVSDILEMDLSGFNTADLKRVASRLVSASNKRIRRMTAKGYAEYSFPVKNALKQYPEGYSTKGKNLNQLHKMVASMRTLLRAETSSVTGFEQVKKDVYKRVGEFPDLDTEKAFWEEYNKYVKDNKDKMRYVDSDVIQKLLHQQRVVKSHTLRGAKSVLTKYLNSIYEEQRQKEIDELKAQRDEIKQEDQTKPSDVFNMSGDFGS